MTLFSLDKSSTTHFQHETDTFVQWYDQIYPELNVYNTKDIFIEFRRNKSGPYFLLSTKESMSSEWRQSNI